MQIILWKFLFEDINAARISTPGRLECGVAQVDRSQALSGNGVADARLVPSLSPLLSSPLSLSLLIPQLQVPYS